MFTLNVHHSTIQLRISIHFWHISYYKVYKVHKLLPFNRILLCSKMSEFLQFANENEY